MKTIKNLIFITLLSLISINTFATGTKKHNTENNYTALFYNTIQKNLNYPQEAKKLGLEGFVIVSFTILPDGRINILELNSSDPMFYKAVVESMSSITLCSHAAGKIYHMRFNYTLL